MTDSEIVAEALRRVAKSAPIFARHWLIDIANEIEKIKKDLPSVPKK